jgi:hypothetical protein
MFTASWRGRLAYLMIRKALSAMRQDLDPHEYGGAPLLGVNGIAIIAHGSSNAHAIRNAIRAASNEALVHQVNAEIVDILAKSESALGAKPAGKGIRGMFAKMRDRLSRTREAEERERRINAASSTVPVGAVAHDDFLPPEERIKREAVETARKESIKESLKKESLKTEATPALEQQTTPLNGAKSTGELHLHNGEKAAEKTVVIETIETNPRKEPRS